MDVMIIVYKGTFGIDRLSVYTFQKVYRKNLIACNKARSLF